MKKFIFAMATLAVWPMSFAHADPLPPAYIGLWCLNSETGSGKPLYLNGDIDGKCSGEYLRISRKGYDKNEDDFCNFVTIKHTGEKAAASTRSRPKDYIPIIRVVAKCEGEGTGWTERRELMYQKGELTSQRLK